jgi:hypothetical protein
MARSSALNISLNVTGTPPIIAVLITVPLDRSGELIASRSQPPNAKRASKPGLYYSVLTNAKS